MLLMDGYQATNEIRKMPATVKQAVPIIALAAFISTLEHKINGARVTDYIYKSFYSNELYLKIENTSISELG